MLLRDRVPQRDTSSPEVLLFKEWVPQWYGGVPLWDETSCVWVPVWGETSCVGVPLWNEMSCVGVLLRDVGVPSWDTGDPVTSRRYVYPLSCSSFVGRLDGCWKIFKMLAEKSKFRSDIFENFLCERDLGVIIDRKQSEE